MWRKKRLFDSDIRREDDIGEILLWRLEHAVICTV